VHPQIVVTAAAQPDPALVSAWTSRIAQSERSEDVVALLHELVPEYAPAMLHIAATPQQSGARARLTTDARADRGIIPAAS
jgi:hypothetical protein